jgi:hypothetical protein
LKVVAGALDEERHLVRHLADVGFRRGEDGQAGALARRAHDEEAGRHLDDGLTCLTAELATRAARERLERGGERGQVLHIRLVHAPGRAKGKTVLREEH